MSDNASETTIASPSISPEEFTLLVETWNQTQVAFPSDASIVDLFFNTAEKFPNETALIWQDHHISYAELKKKVSKLAGMLAAQGVGPEVRVGLCMSRCPDMIVAMLAILWVGGAYVPMDPNYPVERLTFILEDANAPLLITQSRWSHLLAATPAKTMTLDEDWSWDGRTIEAPFSPRLPHQTAYVLFTSGSTGRPKGVQIGHLSVIAMLDWAAREFGPEQRKAVLAATSICFDLSVFEIFLPLTTGTTVVLAENALDLPNVKHPVTLINTVPSAITELWRANQIPASATTINLAGEPLRRDLVAALYGLGTVARVYNLYGPSEDTTYSTWACIDRDGELPPVIGRPLDNTQAFVLNQLGQLVKPEAEGELFLAGDGLARGYLDQPAMTAARFLPNPFGTVPGSRMYKTGDLVRYRPSSDLDFLGRLDHQVKIRGFRIELGEIEDHLRRHKAVLATVVVAIRTGGDPQLAAYIARESSPEQDDQLRKDLRAHLGETLPNYMIPAFMIPMDALPQTPNGKVDRKALPEPQQADQGRTITSPRTETEKQLATIWQDALGFEEIGIFEDFFDLGGDSIRALRIVTQARKEGFQLKTMDLFKERHIAALAQSLPQVTATDKNLAHLDRASNLPVPAEVLMKFPQTERVWNATAMQEGMLFQTQISHDPTEYADVFTFTLNGPLDVKKFAANWHYLTQRHFALRTVFHYMGDYFLQVVLKDFEAPFTFVPQEQFPQDDPELTAFVSQFLLQPGFKATDIPPWNIFLFQEAPERYKFIFMFHHVILDGWSLSILFREFSELQTSTEDSPVLPQKAEFHRFLNWYGDWDQDQGYAYWRKRLSGFSTPNAVLPLPKPKGHMQRSRVRLVISKAVSEKLRQFARKNGLTLNTIIQGAWAILISRYSRSSDVIFGNSGSGRSPEVPGIESMVGLVLQTIVTRIETDTRDSLRNWLHQIQEQHHQDEIQAFCPLVELQKELGATQQNPLFESMIAFENYAGNDWPKGTWAGTELESIHEREEINYGLFLQILPHDAITLKLHVDMNRFEEGGPMRVLEQVAHMLKHIPEMADLPPEHLPFLPEEQKEVLLHHSQPGGPGRPTKTMTERLAQIVQAHPDKTAVVCANQLLSFAGLDRFSTYLANHLIDQGLKPHETVGLCMARDSWLMVAYFGILKAGGVIVPIDPEYPAERKAMIAADAGLKLLISGPGTWCQKAFQVNEVAISKATETHTTHTLPKILPEQLAYIIYTSGSTGKPKGVAITHDAYLNHEHGFAPFTQMEIEDRVLQFSSHTFDMSINEIFMTLFQGATVVIERHKHGLAPDVLYELIKKQHLTVLMITTGFWRVFCEQIHMAGKRMGPQLRLFITGGERMVSENLESWAQIAAENTLLINCYGPTETTVIATGEPYTKQHLERAIPTDVPIGKPVHGYNMHLMSPAGPTPLGVPGELLIGGDSLAMCYFGKPALTAATFIPHHLSDTPGARLYKTGDLIRFNPEGKLMFVDRIDRMVKIRGFRIELGEIEHTMRMLDELSDALVLNEADPMGGQRLAAFAVPMDGAEITARDINTFLEGKLPQFMLPSAYALLDEFPVTLNGKIDRKALPEPIPIKGAAQEAIAPQNQLQHTIAKIWADVLKQEKVGILDNFFDLGGHSLSALAVHQQLQRALGKSFPLVKIFEHPNITSLAAYLDRQSEPTTQKPLGKETSERVANRRQSLRRRRRS